MQTANDILARAVEHHQGGRLVQALACYRQAIGLDPDASAAHIGLGSILFARQSYAEAEKCCREVLRIEPESSAGFSNLAAVLVKLGRFTEAEEAAGHAVKVDNKNAGAYNNLANALIEQEKPEEAEACLREALRTAPARNDLRLSLGSALRAQLRLEEARTEYEAVLRRDPQNGLARLNRAMVLLQSGDWGPGWKEYEARWETGEHAPRSFLQPVWRGQPLEERPILLHAEQGLGDTVQFLRYVALVKQKHAYVLVECPPKLLRIAKTVDGVDQVVGRGAALDFDAHASLLSLPRILGTTLENVPARSAYLAADPQLTGRWGERLASAPGFKIGLAWRGNPNNKDDRRRSLDPELLRPLAEVAGVSLFALHSGPVPDGVRELETASSSVDHVAAMMMHLDLVISVDTLAAHLAGALGREVWTLLAFVPDFRWLLGRDDTPWYPTMRLFRQTARGDWAGVLDRVVQELRSRCPQ